MTAYRQGCGRQKGTLIKMAELRFADVCMVYGDGIIALEHVSFNIRQGEFVFLIGRSGAGKSTVLKLADALESPTSGEIYLDGVATGALPRTQLPYYRRKFGIMDSDVGLLEDRNILENVLLALKATGHYGKKAKETAWHACGITGISNKALFFPAQLSGGERARAMLARAIVGSPRILLLDEPTANLDGESSWDFMRLLNRLNQEVGMTVVATSHDHQMVSVMKKRVITLSAGRVVADERSAIYNMRAADILEERRVLNERQNRAIR